MKKNFLKPKMILLVICVCITSFIPIYSYSENSSFSDISNHWAKSYIVELMNKGIVNGYLDNSFKPNNTVNKDEFIKMLISALGYNLENGENHWASTFIHQAELLGIVEQGEFSFYSDPITRGQMSKMIVLALDEINTDNWQSYKNLVVDYDSISYEYQEYVLKAYSNGLITGYQDGNFKPENTLTRAEASTVIMRIIDPSLRVKVSNTEEENQTDLGNTEHEITNQYTIVDTGQTGFYSDTGSISKPKDGQSFYGQDANYETNPFNYIDNGDGTISDLTTGLMWQKDAVEKQTYSEAQEGAAVCTLGGYDDWRVPTIKELYSLIDFNGVTGRDESSSTPYLNNDYFTIYYGDEDAGERFIDSQYLSSTKYVGTAMYSDSIVFGVNFIDGRIKGYPSIDPRTGEEKPYYTLYVRDNVNYGENQFVDNGDGTITDTATGLMWMQLDSGSFDIGNNGAMNWEEALEWAENFEYAECDDWKLPDAKELQSIVDYSRCPEITDSPAIDPIFNCTLITVEEGVKDYGFYWTSTTHLDGPLGKSAAYVAFGTAYGYPFGNSLTDVHGAGCQRSDPKSGDPEDYEGGFGPQGDVRRIYNMVRLVRVVD